MTWDEQYREVEVWHPTRPITKPSCPQAGMVRKVMKPVHGHIIEFPNMYCICGTKLKVRI